MIQTTLTTPFEASGAKWELLTFKEIPGTVFARMLEPGDKLEYDGKLRPVRFRPNHGRLFPCLYLKQNNRSMTISIPMSDWRKHYGCV